MKKINLFALFSVLIIAGMCFTSCNKDDETPMVMQTNQVKNFFTRDSIAPVTRSISDWTGLDVRAADGGFVSGIFLYRRGTANTYVVKVNLSHRQIKAYYVQNGTSNGIPLFNRYTASSFNLPSYNWYALVNASFFWLNDTPTKLSFFLKKNGSVIAAGTSSYKTISEDGPRKYFAIDNNQAYIGDAQWTTTLSGTVPTTESEMATDMNIRLPYYDVFCGLDPVNANKNKTSSIGRTMVGINSSEPGIVYILVAKSLKQITAYNYLINDFGCTDVVMFDGRYSSQFKFTDLDNTGWGFSSTRAVPVFFAIK
jgi:hypothetical protein